MRYLALVWIGYAAGCAMDVSNHHTTGGWSFVAWLVGGAILCYGGHRASVVEERSA